MSTNQTPTPDNYTERAYNAERFSVSALTARVAELEAALSFIRDEAYRGIGANQPEADAYFRTIEECARRRLARDRAAMAKEQACITELESALRELSKACEYVSPIAGAVATEAKVSHIRQAGRFMKACAAARAALAKGQA